MRLALPASAALVATVLAASLADGATAATAGQPDPDRVWVKFKPQAREQARQALARAGARFHHAFDSLGAFVVTVPAAAQAALRRHAAIEYIEPDVTRHPMAEVQPYGIGMVQAPQVWSAGVTGHGVKVCVIDSGVHASHPDFTGIAMQGNTGSTTDACGHGTHVAGTIAARANAAGVVGVNTGAVALHVLKVFDTADCTWTYSSTLVAAAQACQAAGAKVINMSLGGGRSSTTERNAFQTLYNQGVLSVAAAGNDGSTRLSYPASYDSVISVGALDANKTVASFSQRNSQVELTAPGVSVLSTVPWASGTVVVDGSPHIAAAMDGSVQATASNAPMVDGGRCIGANATFSGKAVVCERGDNSFAEKAAAVFAGGGVAAIVYNNVAGSFVGTLGTDAPPLPVVSMTREDGLVLLASVNGLATVSTVPGPNGHEFYDGTSMATPHVAGVAALVWSANPAWTNVQIRNALAATAEDLGPAGRDTSYGFGLVRAKAALDHLQGGGGGGGVLVTAKVGSLTLSTSTKGGSRTTRASVIIVDAANTSQGLAGAAVRGCFTGAVSGCSTATTTSTGQVGFSSPKYGSGAVTFCVESVTGANIAFTPNPATDCRATP